MAAKKKARKKAKTSRNTITVHDFKQASKSPAKLSALLKKASRSKIGFVVLNAPFKLRTA